MPPRVTWMARASVPGDRRLGLQLVRNALRLGSGHKALEHHGVDVRPPRDDRTRPADDLAVLRFVDARIVRGVGDVEGERHVGVHGMGACHGAAGADLLLSGGHRDEVARGAAGAGQLLHDATGDPHAALVIEALRDGHVVAEPLESDAERDGVAHPHKLLHALGLHAQIDNEGGERRHRLALVRLDEVDGLGGPRCRGGCRKRCARRPACRAGWPRPRRPKRPRRGSPRRRCR